MGEELHERQDKAIRDIENRLTRIEVLLEARDKKSDEMLVLVHEIAKKMDNLPSTFVLLREFNEYKAGANNTSSANFAGVKTWQALVLAAIIFAGNAALSYVMSH